MVTTRSGRVTDSTVVPRIRKPRAAKSKPIIDELESARSIATKPARKAKASKKAPARKRSKKSKVLKDDIVPEDPAEESIPEVKLQKRVPPKKAVKNPKMKKRAIMKSQPVEGTIAMREELVDGPIVPPREDPPKTEILEAEPEKLLSVVIINHREGKKVGGRAVEEQPAAFEVPATGDLRDATVEDIPSPHEDLDNTSIEHPQQSEQSALPSEDRPSGPNPEEGATPQTSKKRKRSSFSTAFKLVRNRAEEDAKMQETSDNCTTQVPPPNGAYQVSAARETETAVQSTAQTPHQKDVASEVLSSPEIGRGQDDDSEDIFNGIFSELPSPSVFTPTTPLNNQENMSIGNTAFLNAYEVHEEVDNSYHEFLLEQLERRLGEPLSIIDVNQTPEPRILSDYLATGNPFDSNRRTLIGRKLKAHVRLRKHVPPVREVCSPQPSHISGTMTSSSVPLISRAGRRAETDTKDVALGPTFADAFDQDLDTRSSDGSDGFDTDADLTEIFSRVRSVKKPLAPEVHYNPQVGSAGKNGDTNSTPVTLFFPLDPSPSTGRITGPSLPSLDSEAAEAMEGEDQDLESEPETGSEAEQKPRSELETEYANDEEALLFAPIQGNAMDVGSHGLMPKRLKKLTLTTYPGEKRNNWNDDMPLSDLCSVCQKSCIDWSYCNCSHASCRWCWYNNWEVRQLELGRHKEVKRLADIYCQICRVQVTKVFDKRLEKEVEVPTIPPKPREFAKTKMKRVRFTKYGTPIVD